jgi:hypothetical protein
MFKYLIVPAVNTGGGGIDGMERCYAGGYSQYWWMNVRALSISISFLFFLFLNIYMESS